MSLFVFTSATAPILGVVFGGASVDYIGGYKGSRQRARAMRLVLVYGVLANVAAYAGWFKFGLVTVIAFIWALLFFGGACLPALAGGPEQLRLGLGLGPGLTGGPKQTGLGLV